MRYRSLYTLLGVLFCTVLFLSNSSNPPNARTGAPGDDGTCATGCHGGGSYQGNLSISGIPTNIQAGQTYTVTLTATATVGSPVVGGFQILALDESNSNVGDMIVTNGAETGTNSQGGREYMEHRGAKNYSGNSVSWTFDWQAPNGPNDENITFWFVSVMANNNGQNSGDNVLMQTQTGTIFGAPDPLFINLDTKMDVSCFGGNDGTATVSTTGGTPPVTVNWSNGQSGPTAINLTAGTYTATAMDALGVTANIMVTISQPSQLFLNIVSESPLTCTSSASITVDGQGGTPGYSYLWSTGTPGPTEILDNANTVTVSVTDSKGCVASIDITPEVNINPPSISVSGGVLTCNEPSITLQLTANSPCGIFTYEWTDPGGNFFSSDSAPSVVSPGIYTVVVTDVCNGCTESASATVTIDNAVPSISLNGSLDTITCLQPIIEIDLEVLANVTYSWSTVNGTIEYGKNEAIVGVSQGAIYTVILTNTINGCTNTLDFQVEEINALLGTIDSTAMPLCFGQPNGYAKLSSNGGLPPLVFLWPDSSLLQIRNDLAAGTYSVALSDSLGCVDTLVVIIGQPTPLLANIGSMAESGLGSNDGAAWVAPTGGTPGYTVLWGNGETTDTISPLAPGTYFATVTDQNGCTIIKSTTVQAFGCALVGVSTTNSIICFGDSTGSVTVSWMNENGNVMIEWSTGDTTAQVDNLPAGEYIVNLTDEGNCTFSDTVIIDQAPEIIILVDSIHHTSGMGATDGSIYISVSGGSNSFTYVWLYNGLEVGSTKDLMDVGAGSYTVQVTDGDGCIVSLTEIEIQDPSSLNKPSWSDQVDVFPVPMKDIIQIHLPKDGNYTLRLLDSRGTIQQSITNQTVNSSIPVQHLPQGAYWLVIQDVNGAFIVRSLIK